MRTLICQILPRQLQQSGLSQAKVKSQELLLGLMCVAGPLRPSQAICCCFAKGREQGIGLELEQLGQEPVPICDASITGGSYVTKLGPVVEKNHHQFGNYLCSHLRNMKMVPDLWKSSSANSSFGSDKMGELLQIFFFFKKGSWGLWFLTLKTFLFDTLGAQRRGLQ